MENSTKVVSKKSKKLHTSVKDSNTNSSRFSNLVADGANRVTENNELIKRYPIAAMVEKVDADGKWFLAMGINRITPIFNSATDLQLYIDASPIELMCSIALTITTVMIEGKNN